MEVRSKVTAGQAACMLVTLGPCGECLKFPFPDWQALARAHRLGFVGVANATPTRVAEFARDSPVKLPVVSDEDGAVTTPIHAVLAGRVFIFNRQWRLVWRSRIDGDTSMRSGEMAECRRFLAGGVP